MSKYRIYQIAKEFSLDPQNVIDILNKHNYKVTSNFNSVGEEERAVVAKVAKASTEPSKPTTKATSAKPEQRQQQSAKHSQHHNQGRDNKRVHNHHTTSTNRPERGPERTERRQDNRLVKSDAKSQPEHRNSQHSRSQHHGERSPKEHLNRQGNLHNERNERTNRADNRNVRTERAGRANRAEQVEQRPHNNGMSNNKTSNKNNQFNKSNKGKNKGNNNQFNGNNRARNNRGRNNRNNQVEHKPQEIIRPKLIKLGETITVKELASKMTYPVSDVIKKLMLLGTMATINQELDFATAALIAEEFGIGVEELPPEVDLTEIPELEINPDKLKLRPPVVTVMGHVDHGKTSLLDAIRKTSVIASEAGGITQHIGAYQVMCNGEKIVFLDTPGHEAFTAMRARGAQVTDIAVLVVAADDGVMPQTIEGINHAKAANVPIVVAINKIDKPGSNPDHVKQQLAEHGLIPEEWGGTTIMVPVSAKKKEGINDLLEMLLLVAEVQELKADASQPARGVIIEARLDKGRGSVASVLVQNGTLHIGDFIIAGTACGKVRAMINDRGEKVKIAGPSTPVEVLGLADVPEAGDELAVLDEKLAKTIADKRIEKQRNELMKSKKVSLDDLFTQISDGDIKELNILIKADVQGSVEALSSSLLGLNKNESEVRVAVIHSGVGAVTESDVMLASAANALIIAFNVRPDANARRVADAEGIDINMYRVIYEAIDDIQAAMKGMLSPKYKEVIKGKVEIRQVMKFSKALVAGCYVLEGKVTNSSKLRLIRDNIVLHEGQIESLRRFKDDVKEVASGYECGITLDNYRDFKEGDILEIYDMEEIPVK